ncbi:MAG: ATP-binding cassette domain-containing protein [Lachnospiraceae bacterium]|nr:ATP-binding cassette domain-containing protein [Lachnospiraceae bacterium]
MAQIRVTDLSFTYEGSFDPVLENVSFNIDTDWKLGLVGRNGKGKTTLLNLLMGKYEYEGSISTNTVFDYFPYEVSEEEMEKTAEELSQKWKSNVELWQIMVQLNQIKMDAECLFRPFKTLSHGERTRVMLAVLFSSENEFLLIDEPTNHLDMNAREIIKEYLASKTGFILVSHDRDLLDAIIDHVLVFNRNSVEVQSGNFSSWWENKEKNDNFAMAENEKHLKEIGRLKTAMDRSGRWAEKNENTKIGFDPLKEPERNISTRAYIGAKTKKMQARVKTYEKRMDREISEKEGLLKDIEKVTDLKIYPLTFHKEILVNAYQMSLSYEGSKPLFENLTFDIKRSDRVILSGRNGCGKSSIIKAVLREAGKADANADSGPDKTAGSGTLSKLNVGGTLDVAGGLVISYISQDTSFLKGTLKKYCLENNLDETLLYAILHRLDFEKTQYLKNMEDFSEGQKKKVLVASSLITPAHLYIWDEPLNYIDVFSRMQIEKLILDFKPTMLLVEHDIKFREKIATKTVEL